MPNAEYKRSTVRCTLTLRDADSENKFTASAKITPACNHKYSPWVDAEHGEHSRTCSLCSHVQLQSHTWDNGKPGEPIGDLEGTLYTCTACGSQQNVPVNTFPQSNSSGAQAPWGNDLSGIGQWGSSFGDNTTEPTQPSSPDNQPSSSGNQVPWGKDHSENDQEGNNLSGNGQWGNPFGDNTPEENTEPTQATTFANNPWMDPYLQPNQETTPPTEDPLQNQTPIWMEHLDTSIFQETTAPAEDSSEEEHDHSQTAPTVDPHAGHDHTQINQEINPLTVCILLGVLVLGLIVALLFLKKKKRH